MIGVEITLVMETTAPMRWTVEALNVDNDGGIASASFSGPFAEQTARDFALRQYGVACPRVMAI
jgi:hypothetical protein